MLDTIDLEATVKKKTYKKNLRDLQNRLHFLQRQCYRSKVGSLIVFEGRDTAGKGRTVKKLTERLEPRRFKVHAVQAPRTTAMFLPWMWRYWQMLPNWGEMGIFDRSWYGRVIIERVERLATKKEWLQAYEDINRFEQSLADDHYVIIKFFLHISQEEQLKRLRFMASDDMLSWKLDDEDWARNRKFSLYEEATQEMLERTHTKSAPWTVVAATDHRWAKVRVFETIIKALEDSMTQRGFGDLLKEEV